jgi:hypothetical protein
MTRRFVALGGAVLALGLLGAACGGDDSVSTTTRSSTSTSTTSSTTTSTTLPTTADTTSVTVGVICDTPEDAVQGVVAAWGADDRGAASRCATAPVLDLLFRGSGVGNTWQFQGCDRTADPGIPRCAFSYEGGAAFFTVEGTEAAGWKATALEFLAD